MNDTTTTEPTTDTLPEDPDALLLSFDEPTTAPYGAGAPFNAANECMARVRPTSPRVKHTISGHTYEAGGWYVVTRDEARKLAGERTHSGSVAFGCDQGELVFEIVATPAHAAQLDEARAAAAERKAAELAHAQGEPTPSKSGAAGSAWNPKRA
jgi:hypothetical protein